GHDYPREAAGQIDPMQGDAKEREAERSAKNSRLGMALGLAQAKEKDGGSEPGEETESGLGQAQGKRGSRAQAAYDTVSGHSKATLCPVTLLVFLAASARARIVAADLID